MTTLCYGSMWNWKLMDNLITDALKRLEWQAENSTLALAPPTSGTGLAMTDAV